MNNKLILCLAFIFCFLGWSHAQTSCAINTSGMDVEKWISGNFSKGKVPPFSFNYDGVPSAKFIRGWKYSMETLNSNDPLVIKKMFVYQDPATGLKVRCEVTGFKDYKAVEWVLHFVNTGKQNTPEIANVCESDIHFMHSAGEPTIYYANGSNASITDYQQLSKKLAVGDSLNMVPVGGRSSSHAFPFFNMEMPNGQGVMVAIGWTGTWKTEITAPDAKDVSLKTGIRDLKSYLYPDEAIRTASVCLLFWNGENRFAGHNKFRQFVLAHHTRMVNGKRAVYPISTMFNYQDPAPCNEYSCITADYAISIVKRFKQFNLVSEVFWLDAGWYTGAGDYVHDKQWWNTVGNWTADSARFPNGLRPVSEAVHQTGAKFMVWFEPERVYEGTTWAVQHPQWMLKYKDNEQYLFDLGNPEARRWLSTYMGNFLEENGIDYYRQDFNINPSEYWKAHDEAGRQGMSEIKYIEGLYDYWDSLLKRFPNLLIDNCASGGRRIDLETISRSAPMWRTDYNYGEPVGYQYHTYGLELYLPLHGSSIWSPDKFIARSGLGSSVVYCWKVTNPGVSFIDMQNSQKEFREVRPYFYEDYYPLTGSEVADANKRWLAYQLHRQSDDSGYIVAFRHKDNADNTISVKLFSLSAKKKYQIEDKDTKAIVVKSGKELMDGLTLTLEKPSSSLLLFYKVCAE